MTFELILRMSVLDWSPAMSIDHVHKTYDKPLLLLAYRDLTQERTPASLDDTVVTTSHGICYIQDLEQDFRASHLMKHQCENPAGKRVTRLNGST